MRLNLNAIVVAALAALAAASANATLTVDQTSAGNGNGSVVFVALDNNGSTGNGSSGNSLTIDLGALMSDMLAGPGTQGVPATQSTFQAGTLSAPGTTVVWNFSTNTETINGVASSNTISYSSQYQSFLSAVAADGNSYSWGVVSAERSNNSTTASATNPIANQNVLMTVGDPASFGITPNSTNISTMATAVANLLTGSQGLGTQSSAANTQGANTATTGAGYVGTGVNTNFGGIINASLMTSAASTASLYVAWLQQASVSKLYMLDGTSYGVGALGASPATFTFDPAAGTLTYQVAAVPEPETYAMLAAGLAAIGFVIRRRNAG